MPSILRSTGIVLAALAMVLTVGAVMIPDMAFDRFEASLDRDPISIRHFESLGVFNPVLHYDPRLRTAASKGRTTGKVATNNAKFFIPGLSDLAPNDNLWLPEYCSQGPGTCDPTSCPNRQLEFVCVYKYDS